MTFIFIILGGVLGWLVRTSWTWHLAKETSEKARQKCREKMHRDVYGLILVLFVTVCVVLANGVYGTVHGQWSWSTVILLWYLKLPNVLSSVIGFIIAALAVLNWESLAKDFPDWLHKTALGARRSRGAAHRRTGDRAPTGLREPYSWLTGIIGIAAVTLLGIVTLVIFFPEVLTRVESIKVAGLEARFATTASHNQSIRLASETAIDVLPITSTLGKWKDYGAYAKDRYRPAQDLIDARWNAPQTERDRANKIIAVGDNFLDSVAVPLAKVMHCLASEFDVRDTDVQHKTVKVASEWARVFTESGDRLSEAVAKTYELIVFIDRDLASRASTCGGTEKIPWERAWTAIDCENNCGKNGSFMAKVNGIVNSLKPNLDLIASNGFVITFIAHLNVTAKKAPEVLELMDKMANRLDVRRGTLIAQLRFYLARSQVKFAAGNRAAQSNGDLIDALALNDKVIKIIDACDTTKPAAANVQNAIVNSCATVGVAVDFERLGTSYSLQRVGILNNLLYNLIWDWLNGRHLTVPELFAMEGLPTGGYHYKLSEWLRQQSIPGLRDRADRPPQG